MPPPPTYLQELSCITAGHRMTRVVLVHDFCSWSCSSAILNLSRMFHALEKSFDTDLCNVHAHLTPEYFSALFGILFLYSLTVHEV